MDQTAYFEQMRQKRRSEILETARRMILDQGLFSFSMQGLAQTLDVSTVTLYKYYKNILKERYNVDDVSDIVSVYDIIGKKYALKFFKKVIKR